MSVDSSVKTSMKINGPDTELWEERERRDLKTINTLTHVLSVVVPSYQTWSPSLPLSPHICLTPFTQYFSFLAFTFLLFIFLILLSSSHYPPQGRIQSGVDPGIFWLPLDSLTSSFPKGYLHLLTDSSVMSTEVCLAVWWCSRGFVIYLLLTDKK